MKCEVCRSEGFEPSVTGKGCEFCDGTVGGNPPWKCVGCGTWMEKKEAYFLSSHKEGCDWASMIGITGRDQLANKNVLLIMDEASVVDLDKIQ